MNYSDPEENITKIIGDSILDMLIDKNYIHQQNAEKQEGGRCWAYSITAAIYLASARVFGRKIKKFSEIFKQILTDENAYKDKKGEQGRNIEKILEKYLHLYKLRYREVSPEEARYAVMKGRPCLCRFYYNEKKWHNFSNFFAKYPKGILTKEIIEAPINYI